MTLESLAQTIANARNGTDAHWAQYVDEARAIIAAHGGASAEFEQVDEHNTIEVGREDVAAALRYAYHNRKLVDHDDKQWLVTGYQMHGANSATIFTLEPARDTE